MRHLLIIVAAAFIVAELYQTLRGRIPHLRSPYREEYKALIKGLPLRER